MQEDINSMKRWWDVNELPINVKKTKIVLDNVKQDMRTCLPIIKIDNIP